jgi:Plant transposon protein
MSTLDSTPTVAALCMLMYMSIGVASLFLLDSEEEEDVLEISAEALAEGLSLVRRIERKHARWEEQADEPLAKRKKYDYFRARDCIMKDYLGPDPLFGRYFERIFRVSRSIVETLINICGSTNSFFTQSVNKITGEQGICQEAKILMALQILGYGCSPTAFMAYFQMSEKTGRYSLRNFCRVVAHHPMLRQNYLRRMSKSDAMVVSNMHYHEFGIRGCIGALDCMHVWWKNCPVAWKGQYEGKDSCPSIVLEAVADYTTRIWHNRFGFPGTMNDINVWDQSSLLRSFLDGTFTTNIDFPFRIADKTFNKVWVLTDGIYPELSRFVKSMTVPITKAQKLFTKWQESCRKCVERAFGILRRKFQILSRPFELLFEEDIRNVVDTCIILHNMMVEARLQRNEDESEQWYDISNEDHDDGNEEFEVPLLRMHIPVAETVIPNVQERLSAIALQWPDDSIDPERSEAIRDVMEEHFNAMRTEWQGLYNRTDHFELRDAIMEQVVINNGERNNEFQK